MISFKQFMREAAVDAEPKYEVKDIKEVKEAIDLFETHCKDALWMLKNNQPIYRGFKNLSPQVEEAGFVVVDSSATERRSENTRNYYTIILDTSPYMKDYPKRSRSFICTTSISVAKGFGYGVGANVFRIIPFDGVKIGVCSGDDMWATHVTLFDRRRRIDALNDTFHEMGLTQKIESFQKFDKKLKDGDEEAEAIFRSEFSNGMKYKNDFLAQIYRAYSPQELGFKCFTTKDFPRNGVVGSRELWIGGKVLMISQEMWNKMLREYEYLTGEDK